MKVDTMTKAQTVETALNDAISANFQATPNDKAPDGAEVLGGVIYKGTTGTGDDAKTAFQAVVNGISGAVKPQFKTAIVDAMVANNVVAANYDRPDKWTDVYKTNKEPEPTSLDDLDDKTQKAFNAGYTKLEKMLAADDTAMLKMRDVNFKLASTVVAIRGDFPDSISWSRFKKFAPIGPLSDFLGKNTVSEFYKAGRILDLEGFDADQMIVDRVSGAKGVVSAYQTVINAVAANVVACIGSEKVTKLLELEGNDSTKILAVLDDMVDQNSFSITEAGDQIELDATQTAMAGVVIPLHLGNMQACELDSMLNYDGDKITVKKPDGWKFPCVQAKLGLEGADELLSAIVRVMNAAKVPVVKDDPAVNAADAMKKAVADTKQPFAKWSQDVAARHLANILFSRFEETEDDAKREEEVADIRGIIGRLEGWAEAIFAENADIADLLDPEASMPADEDDAEAAADAD